MAIDNFGDALYFTVVTLTTVGFGDITPGFRRRPLGNRSDDIFRYHPDSLAGRANGQGMDLHVQ